MALPLQGAQLEAAPVRTVERRLQLRSAAPSVAQAQDRGQLILLAEDNETNSEVLREQLRLLGYAAEVACDGADALAQWRSGRFALLLTDCHMPHMDGFELTSAIRQLEAPGTRRPIIAVTANAMLGEAQRCLEHGMDDYLSKPLRLHELAAMLTKWLPLDAPASVAEVAAPAAQVGSHDAAPGMAPERESADASNKLKQPLTDWDAGTLVGLVGDNPGLHRRLLEKFLRNAAEQVSAITAAVQAGDTKAATDVAHILKSAAGSMGALALGALCRHLETTGQAGDERAIGAQLAELHSRFDQARQCILAHLARLPNHVDKIDL